MAPEVLRDEEYTTKSDVFSFGVILWEILTREKPYKGYNSLDVIEKVGVAKEKAPGLRMNVPKCPFNHYSDLIVQCWEEIPSKRPLMSEIVVTLQKLQNIANQSK